MNETFKEQLDKHDENERLGLYKEAHDLNPYRSQVIEEVAQHIEAYELPRSKCLVNSRPQHFIIRLDK